MQPTHTKIYRDTTLGIKKRDMAKQRKKLMLRIMSFLANLGHIATSLCYILLVLDKNYLSFPFKIHLYLQFHIKRIKAALSKI